MSRLRKRFPLLVCLSIIFFCFWVNFPINAFAKTEVSGIEKGQLNIQNEKLADIGPIKLEGEWQFFWGDFLTSTEIAANQFAPSFVEVPDNWHDYEIDRLE